MQVQEYIQEFGWEALEAEPLNIKIRYYKEVGIAVLNYSQIESPKNHPIVVECRSLILSYPDGDVISRSFDRFYNHGECPDFYTDFDINRAQVFEKEDGSLIKVYWCEQTSRWEISTRSQAFGEGEHLLGGVFRDYVLKAMRLNEESFQEVMNLLCSNNPDRLDLTYNCELIGPSNRIVRQYTENEVVLLSIRMNTGDYKEFDYSFVVEYAGVLRDLGMNVRPVKVHALGSFEEIIENAKNLPCLEEGYVCFDPVSGKRVKLKNPSYVAIHHLRDNGTPSMKRVFTLVLENEQDEYLGYFPEDRGLFEPAITAVADFKATLVETWEKVKDIEGQKDFAMVVKDLQGSGFLFKARQLKVCPTHVFDEADMNKRLGVFGY